MHAALLIVGIWLVLAAGIGLASRLLCGRGEVADAPDPFDEAVALTGATHPDLLPWAAEVADIDTERIAALYLTDSPQWSNR